jgi:hypothetical protein
VNADEYGKMSRIRVTAGGKRRQMLGIWVWENPFSFSDLAVLIVCSLSGFSPISILVKIFQINIAAIAVCVL